MVRREYPFEKAILLNAVYDVLERLDWPLVYANSRAGVLRFAWGAGVGEMELTAILRDGAEVTRVEIGGAEQEISDILFDEITSALYQDDRRERREAV